MQYLGGKARQARHLARVIARFPARRYVEPFLGGGSVAERVVGSFPTSVLSDAHVDLMLMWLALVFGWVPPEEVSAEEYRALRHAEPSALRGLVGFGGSFGGKWFGGYAVIQPDAKHVGGSLYRPGRAGALRKADVFRVAGSRLQCSSYEEIDVGSGDLVYCDPPYAGTTPYGGLPPFDHDKFWATAQDWADAGADVLISEYQAPPGTPCVWERPAARSLKASENGSAGGAVERLYALGDNGFRMAIGSPLVVVR